MKEHVAELGDLMVVVPNDIRQHNDFDLNLRIDASLRHPEHFARLLLALSSLGETIAGRLASLGLLRENLAPEDVTYLQLM